MIKIVYDAVMAAEIINLRHKRKQQKRADAAGLAAENRARFGQTKASREKRELESARALRELEGHKLTEGEDDHK